ncbi:ComEC/Rec2 family competence protein [Clostridium butyricum]|uniref:ComEC/Rec2 family competence protein n=1 Tax=Clostridium butyricum TaxID=1492 RepID=UPI00311AF1B5
MAQDCTIDGCYINSSGIWVQQDNNSAAQNTNSVTGELNIHFIDVGQADSILIQQGNENMLIDAGNNDDENTLKNYLVSLGVKELKYAIATHPHEDHIGSMNYIINSLKVGQIYAPKVTASTKTYENLVNAVKNKGMQFKVPSVGETFYVGQAKCTILAPNNSTYDDLNNYSIVVKVEFGNNSFLFTGDAEETSEKEMLSKGLNLKADVLKVGHHGSRTSSSDTFLNAVNAKYAVISVGKSNDYGHPNSETLARLNSRKVDVYRTDIHGTVIAVSDGNTIKIKSPDTLNNVNISEISVNNTSSNITELVQSDEDRRTVYVSRNNGKIYHYDKTCSGLKNPNEMTLEEAKNNGLRACAKCVK